MYLVFEVAVVLKNCSLVSSCSNIVLHHVLLLGEVAIKLQREQTIIILIHIHEPLYLTLVSRYKTDLTEIHFSQILSNFYQHPKLKIDSLTSKESNSIDFLSRSVCLKVCVSVCAFLYLLPTESQNTHSTNKVRTILGNGGIFWLAFLRGKTQF